MITFDSIDLKRVAVASVGAVALSATCILGVSAPARAAVPTAPTATVAEWRHVVERRLDSNEEVLPLAGRSVEEAVLAVRCDVDGRCGDVSLAQSSGDRLVDRAAIAAGRDVVFPLLPVSYRGRPTIVEVHVFYGASRDAVARARTQARRLATLQYADRGAGSAKVIAK